MGSKNQFSSGGVMVGFEQLKPGDLMFFSHNGRQIQHVGIYIDKNHFIHAPRTGRRISIDELGRYWKQKFVKRKNIHTMKKLLKKIWVFGIYCFGYLSIVNISASV